VKILQDNVEFVDDLIKYSCTFIPLKTGDGIDDVSFSRAPQKACSSSDSSITPANSSFLSYFGHSSKSTEVTKSFPNSVCNPNKAVVTVDCKTTEVCE
jgi:hypothetical protein